MELMRNAPGEATLDERPIANFQMSEAEVRDCFPVELRVFPDMTEPEPSIGALIQTDKGSYFGVSYGMQSEQLRIYGARSSDPEAELTKLLADVPALRDHLNWRRRADGKYEDREGRTIL